MHRSRDRHGLIFRQRRRRGPVMLALDADSQCCIPDHIYEMICLK